MLESSGRLLLWNRAAQRVFGSSGLGGSAVHALLSDRDRDDLCDRLAAVEAERAGPVRFHASARRHDGSEFPAELHLSPLDLDGQSCITCTIRDIGESARAQEALAARSSELQRCHSDLQSFAYRASHDLQEPLRTVESFVKLLAMHCKGKLDPEAEEFIGYIVDGSAQMRALLEGLLAYSRVGTTGTPFGTVDTNTALDRAVAGLRAQIDAANAIVDREPLPLAHGDSTQVLQLFTHLLLNALKFHKPGEAPRIRVWATRSGNEWTFAMRDEGIGIDPQYEQQIFVIFRRLHTRKEYPGTGIGLAICKRIVERHGGRIWVESLPGRGATFYFSLPAVPGESDNTLDTKGQA